MRFTVKSTSQKTLHRAAIQSRPLAGPLALLALMLSISSFSLSCAKEHTSEELQAAKSIGLSAEDLGTIKSLSKGSIALLASLGPQYRNAEGIAIELSFTASIPAAARLGSLYRAKGYQVFLARQRYNLDGQKNVLAIIRSADPMDVLRVQGTNYLERGLSTEDLIQNLNNLQAEFNTSFTISGAESSWAELSIRALPQDLQGFVNALCQLSPELLNDGSGRIEDIQAQIEKNKKITLFFY